MIGHITKKWKLLTTYLLGATAGFTVIAGFTCQYMAQKIYLPEANQFLANTLKHQNEILKDLKLLEEKPIFIDTPHTKNAQEFLTQHISWVGADFQPLETSQIKTLEKFKRPLSFNNLEQLQTLFTNKDLMQMNLSWMEELLNYDHLDFTSHPKIKTQIQRVAESGSLQRIAIMADLPMPQLSQLREFALIYFLQKHQKGNIKQGLLIFEHVTKILHSENTLVAQMLVVALLKTENQLKQFLKFNENTLASDKTILAYKRLSWAWIGISLLPWAKQDISVFEPYMKRKNGMCSAIGESTIQDNFRDFFEPHFLFENDMSSNFENLRAYQKKIRTLCQAQHFKIFDQSVKDENNLFINQSPSEITLNWARVPYVRRLLGSIMIGVGTLSWVKQYEDLAAATN